VDGLYFVCRTDNLLVWYSHAPLRFWHWSAGSAGEWPAALTRLVQAVLVPLLTTFGTGLSPLQCWHCAGLLTAWALR